MVSQLVGISLGGIQLFQEHLLETMVEENDSWEPAISTRNDEFLVSDCSPYKSSIEIFGLRRCFLDLCHMLDLIGVKVMVEGDFDQGLG